MKIKSLSVAALLLVTGTLLLGINDTSSASSPGKIKGVILDVNDARVVNAIIKVEGDELKRLLKSDDKGQFEISLPPGAYQITIEANGFRRFVYSSLKVKADQTEMINIHVEVATLKVLVPASFTAELGSIRIH
jgi:uncharacterized membrane protein